MHFDKNDLGEGYVPDVLLFLENPGGLGKAALVLPPWEQTVMLSGNNANVRTNFSAVCKGA